MRGCPPLTPRQLRDTLRHLGGQFRHRDRALVHLGVHTGLRVSELLSLKVGDVYSGTAFFSRIYLARKFSKGKHRGASIVLHPRAAVAIGKWLAARGQIRQSDWLFTSQRHRGQPLGRKSVWAILHRALKSSGVEGMAGSHVLRKSYCQRVHAALKGDLFRLAVAMRHTSPLTTLAYLSFRQEEIDRAILRA